MKSQNKIVLVSLALMFVLVIGVVVADIVTNINSTINNKPLADKTAAAGMRNITVSNLKCNEDFCSALVYNNGLFVEGSKISLTKPLASYTQEELLGIRNTIVQESLSKYFAQQELAKASSDPTDKIGGGDITFR